MKPQFTVGGAIAVRLRTTYSSAAQAQSRDLVDPQTRWATRAKLKPADELKQDLDTGPLKIIDVRTAEQFHKETIPGAINIPLEPGKKN